MPQKLFKSKLSKQSFHQVTTTRKIGNHDSLTPPWSTFSFIMTSALTGSTYLGKRFHMEKVQ